MFAKGAVVYLNHNPGLSVLRWAKKNVVAGNLRSYLAYTIDFLLLLAMEIRQTIVLAPRQATCVDYPADVRW